MGVLAKELSDLEPVAQEYATFKSIMTSLNELGPLLADPDMRALAQEEQTTLLTDLTTSADAILTALLPRDIADEGSAVLELRAGAGGSEAALFVRDLFGMYEQYALLEGWQFKPAHCTLAEAGGGGGFKDATAIVSGKGVFARFKFESGTHRVQRVPETEAQGRIHTSTVTVAVLPMPEQVEKLVDIPEKDLRIDVFRASGAGGQHVNTTESAVRLTHLPTGIVVSNQDERSQHKNKAKAMSVMRAKLYDLERSRVQTARRDARRALIGTGDRSERIRTYNFPQGRVTDHRVGVTVHDLHGVLKGIKLGEILDELNVRARLEGLSEVAGE
ncbi:peptide chain release factor 1 [Blastocladiella britannica]|nr:peptide chain release factor 1 [Blastocladiella britannica]